LDSAYNLAINSIPSKMQERLDNAKNAYATLLKFNANPMKKSSADSMLSRIENDLKQFQK
jgi:outer membrane protein assembly factor BamD